MNCGLEIYYTHSNMTILPPFLQRRVQVFNSKGEPKEGKVKMCWSKKISLKFTLKKPRDPTRYFANLFYTCMN